MNMYQLYTSSTSASLDARASWASSPQCGLVVVVLLWQPWQALVFLLLLGLLCSLASVGLWLLWSTDDEGCKRVLICQYSLTTQLESTQRTGFIRVIKSKKCLKFDFQVCQSNWILKNHLFWLKKVGTISRYERHCCIFVLFKKISADKN